jgi:drug/metabolite transporter (DMT)-like permease
VSNGGQTSTGRFIGYTMAMSASILFGFNGNLSRLLFNDGISPVTLVEFRMLIGGACLLFVLVGWRRRELKLPRRSIGPVIVFGLSLALVTYTYFVAISRLPIAVALVIQFSASAWMTLGEAIWRRHIPSMYVLSAIVVTLGGVVLLTGVWHQSLNGLDSMGLLYATLSLVAYIVYLLLGRRVSRDLPPLTSTAYGAVVAGIFWLIVQPPWAVPGNTFVGYHPLLIIVVGIVGMAIPFSLVLGSLRRLDATRVGIASMTELVAAGIIAYFWLGQYLDIWQILGGCLVITGITLLQLEKPQVQVMD